MTSTSVLVVEDNDDHAHLICELLSESDDPVFKTARAGSLTQALELTDRASFEVAILDLGLPESQGLETLEHFQERAPDTAVVVLTAQEVRDLARAAIQHGAQDYLYKTELVGPALCRSLRYALERKSFQVSLAHKNEELETFVRSASHDLKAPLRHMRSFAQLVRRKAANRLEPKEAHYLERIEEAAERMEELLNALRTFGEVGVAALKLEQIPLARLVKEVLEQLPSPQRSAIQVSTLPTVLLDGRLMSLVLKNLIENALKYGMKGAALEAVVEVRHDGTGNTIEIADNGPGIDEQALEHIFEPGRRGVGGEISGSGFGLSIARRVVEAHGHRLWAENRPEGGAVFRFTVTTC